MNNRQLYKISKFAYEEAFEQSQLDMAGSQQAKIMEKMAKNKKYMKIQSKAMKIIVGIFIAIMVIIPIQAFDYINQAMAEGIISTNHLIFAGSLTISVTFLIQILYLIMFGMFFASSLLSGEYLKWLATLPIARKDLRKITMMTFFRGLDIQFIALLIVLPIGTAIMTRSVLLTFISLLLSLINIVFAFSLLVIIGEKVHRVMSNQEANSKKGTIARMVVMMSYILGSIGMSLGINYAMIYIPQLFTEATLAGISIQSIDLLNNVFSLIPLPLTAGFTLIEAMVGYTKVSSTLILTSITGLLLFIGFTFILLKKALALLNNVFLHKSRTFDENAKKTTLEDVSIEITSPVKAFFKKDRQMMTRDIQMMMMVVMPILLPFLGLATTGLIGEEGGDGLIILFTMNVSYMVMSGIMVVWGLMNVESTGATIHASLPIHVRDQVNAKVKWVFLILTIATILPLAFMIGGDTFIDYLVLSLVFYPIGPIVALTTLELKVRLFGKMKYKYVIEDVRIANRVLKWIFIVVVAIIIYIGAFVMMMLFIEALPTGLTNLIIILLAIEAGAGIVLYYFYNKMFPKHRFSIPPPPIKYRITAD